MERTGQLHQKFRNRRRENRATPAFANGTLRDELIVLRATSAGLREGVGLGCGRSPRAGLSRHAELFPIIEALEGSLSRISDDRP